MASVDMCQHDWPGSGCPDCRKLFEAYVSPHVYDGVRVKPPGLLNKLTQDQKDAALTYEGPEDQMPSEAATNKSR